MNPALLDEALEAWSYTRAGVSAELNNLPADEFAFRITPQNRTVAELARHIIENGLMMVGEVARADGDFRRQPYPAFIEEYAGDMPETSAKEPLLAMLDRTHHEGERRLRNAGEQHMLGPIHRFDGQEGSRLAWLNHGIAHEEYHRGQLALYARALGEVPALTQHIRGT